jgi:hypothetical protein
MIWIRSHPGQGLAREQPLSLGKHFCPTRHGLWQSCRPNLMPIAGFQTVLLTKWFANTAVAISTHPIIVAWSFVVEGSNDPQRPCNLLNWHSWNHWCSPVERLENFFYRFSTDANCFICPNCFPYRAAMNKRTIPPLFRQAPEDQFTIEAWPRPLIAICGRRALSWRGNYKDFSAHSAFEPDFMNSRTSCRWQSPSKS